MGHLTLEGVMKSAIVRWAGNIALGGLLLLLLLSNTCDGDYRTTIGPVPLAPPERTYQAEFYVRCSRSGNGTKWGSLEVRPNYFVFGPKDQRWRAYPNVGLSALGERLLIWEIEGRQRFMEDQSIEPDFTVRISNIYMFTPPIDEQAYVSRRKWQVPPWELSARNVARENAGALGLNHCYIGSCYTSFEEKQHFFEAFEAAAASGGEMTISGPTPNGPATIRYPLTGFENLFEQLGRCLA